MTDLDILAAAVAAYPDDDTPRLVLADWYDEHEDATVPCGKCHGRGHYRHVERGEYGPDISRADCDVCGAAGSVPAGNRDRACDLRLEVLLRQVLTTPGDDAPRLEYARVCEEYGRAERGEFIRTQIAIARDFGLPPHGLPVVTGDPAADARERGLRRRERELFDAAGGEWFGSYGYPTLGPTDGPARVGPVLLVRRGFVDAVTLPLAAFAGVVCDNCDGTGVVGRDAGYSSGGPCPDCGGQWEPRDGPGDLGYSPGTGRVPGLAGALFRAHPITVVRLSDMEPRPVWDGGRAAYYVWDAGGDGPSCIPWELFEHRYMTTHPTVAQSYEWLSARCVAWGRTLAGLPPL